MNQAMIIFQFNLNRSIEFIPFQSYIENIISFFCKKTMLNSFSPILNSTNLPIAGPPLSPSQKTSNPSPKQANPISFPGQNITSPKYFFTYCSHCSSNDPQQSQLIWPCKCLTPVHIHCLQNKISSNLNKLRSNKIKCNICRQLYKLEIQQKWHLDITQIFKCQRNIIFYYIVLVLLLTGIISLSIYLHSLYLRHSHLQLQHTDTYQDNSMDFEKNISSANETLNDKNNVTPSIFQIEVMVIVAICCLTVIFMIIMANLCKHHLLKKKAIIIKTCTQINYHPSNS